MLTGSVLLVGVVLTGSVLLGGVVLTGSVLEGGVVTASVGGVTDASAMVQKSGMGVMEKS